jgi:putative RecB family exonuclease
MSATPFRASPSRLNLFRLCRRKYWFEHVKRLGPKFRRPRPHLVMGAHIHETLRLLYTRVPPDARNADVAERILRRVWRRERHGFAGPEEEREYGQRALAMVRRFCALTDLRVDPVATEDTHVLRVDERLWLTGRVDRVDEDAGGAFRVVDYKTGRRPAAAHDRPDQSLQARIYASLVAAVYARRVTRVEMFYLADGVRESVAIAPETPDETIAEVRERVAEILAERAFPPRPGPLCAHCDYLALCEEGRREVAARRAARGPTAPPTD